ncbi:MAG: OmpH family outer membrane protein [Bacteroidales bacterium]|nr:OmpH family outer membrane protein [Bacteroidales bacterium]MDY0216698.1 OmpH family outer membrane protein [Bacteroidales bacterium]
MKKGIIIAVALAFFASLNSFGQAKIKLGHIDSMELLQSMPGRDSAEKVLQAHASTLEKQILAMQSELENKYNTFVSEQATMSQLIQQTKTKELQDLQARIEAFQQSAQKDLQEKEKELVQPIIDKAKKAIEDVGKENAYTYIFDSSMGVLLYDEAGDDIMLLVKKKLGIK